MPQEIAASKPFLSVRPSFLVHAWLSTALALWLDVDAVEQVV
jgi:hypothetical protein